MNRWIEIILNISFWAITGWLITSSYSMVAIDHEIHDGVESILIERDNELIKEIIWYLLISAAMFYANLTILSNKVDSLLQPGTFLLTGLVLIAAFTCQMVSEQIGFPSAVRTPATLSVGVIVFYCSASIAYGVAKHAFHKDKQHQRLIIDKKQAELNLLRNQLHPHFLFNALNNLLSLVDQKKSPVLADSIDKLSSLLRYVIDDIQSEKVPISKEIDFLKRYVALQMLRYEHDEVDFSLTIDGNETDVMIEPGIFIPFLENAFKYGTKPEEQAKIEVNFTFDQPGTVYFSIKNRMLVANQLDRKGTGIAYTRNRLQLVYPDRHQLAINQNNGQFEVTLEIRTK
ncbi:MAG: histidine kinase [Marinoscillum sp.]